MAAALTRDAIVLIISKYVRDFRDVPNLDETLYQRAVTHRSVSAKTNGNNERLEFLGDSVLSLIVTSYLFERYPGENEGFMTRMRTKLVNGVMLAELCRKATALPAFISSTTTSTTNTCNKDLRRESRILEDALEAFLGALFLDQGFLVAKQWFVSLLEQHVDFARLVSQQNNPKDVLNRCYMLRYGCLPRFSTTTSVMMPPSSSSSGGEDDDSSDQDQNVPTNKIAKARRQEVKVVIHGLDSAVIAQGTGANRRAAEDAAARNALGYLHVESLV